jgi:hypothetical protein
VNKQKESSVSYSLSLDEKLFQELERHIFNLKKVRSPLGKKIHWLNQAIKEKLEREKEKVSNLEFKKRVMSFKIDSELNDHLEKSLQKNNPGISKKEWVEKAIKEKITSEYEEVQNLANEIEKHLSEII